MTQVKSQRERVIKRLLDRGQISRNECLQNFISRLSAIIQNLEEEGWEFNTDRIDGDYFYFVKTCPIKKEQFINPLNGSIITRYIH